VEKCVNVNSTFKCALRMGIGWVGSDVFGFEFLQNQNLKFSTFFPLLNKVAQQACGTTLINDLIHFNLN
jgi:hypothetical protein